MKAVAFVVVIALLLLLTPVVWADGSSNDVISTFTYTGSPPTDGQPFNYPSSGISGTFTLSGILPDNAFDLFVTPLSYSYTDGFFTWTPSDVNGQNLFMFSTDANGNIIGWTIALDAITYEAPGISDFDYSLTSSWGLNASQQDRSQLNQDFGSGYEYFEVSRTEGVLDDPVTTVTPEPPGYTLMLSGIGFGLLLWSRKRISVRQM